MSDVNGVANKDPGNILEMMYGRLHTILSNAHGNITLVISAHNCTYIITIAEKCNAFLLFILKLILEISNN